MPLKTHPLNQNIFFNKHSGFLSSQAKELRKKKCMFAPVKKKYLLETQRKYGESLSKEQLRLIEEIGVFATENGIQPAPSRIYGLLLVSDKVELTFDEIRFTLGFSKSATSNGINFLLNSRKIEYITKQGDRKRYFRSNVETWKESLNDGFKYINEYCELLTRVVKVRTNNTPEFNQSIVELTSFLEFAKKELASLYDKWETKGNKKEDDKI